MSWLLAFIGFAVLIVAHELGHYLAARAVGMHVERFALFFPPLILRKTKGETEYAVGAIPLGGYCKISGMDPDEKLPADIEHRAYWRQKPWKKIVVIAAGPAVNLLLAFVFLAILFATAGQRDERASVSKVDNGFPASGVIYPGDKIIAVDGKKGQGAQVLLPLQKYQCVNRQDGCLAKDEAKITVVRQGAERTVLVKPQLDRGKMRLGVILGQERTRLGPGVAVVESVQQVGYYSALTVEGLARLVTPEGRAEVSGVAGSYDATRRGFELSPALAIEILAIISLSLAIINLLPILPLDGGHIVSAVAEWIRGKPLSRKTMQSIAMVGFILMIALFLLGLNNDIERFS